MTDETPAPEPAPERARVEVSRKRRLDALPVLYLLGFAVLAGALAYLWKHPQGPRVLQVQDTSRVETLQQQIQGLNGRIAQLESRPAAPPGPAPEVVTLQQQVATLNQRLTELANRPSPPPPDLGAINTQLADVQTRMALLSGQVRDVASRPGLAATDLGPLTGRVAALEAKVDPLGARIDQIETRDRDALQQMEGRGRDALQQIEARGREALQRIDGQLTALSGQVGALTPRLAAVEAQGTQSASQIAGLTQKTQLATRLQAAADALQLGQKLGPIPGAPPALARFADQPPPTEAQLRISFDQYAEAARKASQPTLAQDKPFGERLWNRAQQVVTVRQGDRVVVGDPISGVLAQARSALDAGDLKGAVDGLSALTGPPAEAVAPWVQQAKALLDARAALATMAAG